MLKRIFEAGGGGIGPMPGRVAFLIAATAALLAGSASAETLTGTAMIRERIALPADVTFEAVIEDISRADAPATPLARTVIEAPGQSPIAFSIDYDPAALDPRAIYALRAAIRNNGQLLFTTDTVNRVLQDGDQQNTEVILKMVPQDSSGAAQPLPAHGLRLPATFRGTLPCADCEGTRHHLDLWPDQYYHMRREWLGKTDGTLKRDEIGRWYADPVRGAIVLYGASEMPLFWQVKAPDRLRQMAMAGSPIESDLPYALTSDGTLEPTELEGLVLLGRMTYMADAALFEECFSGVRYPIAQEDDYLSLERAYLEAAPSPGAPVIVHVEGDLAARPAMDAPPRTSLVVDRFIAVRPDDSCARPEPQASLTNTYWRIDSLMGAPLLPVDGRREPHLVLPDMPEARFRATVGCNQIIGRYDTDGDALTFTAAASTLMACPPPIDMLERQLRDILAAPRTFALDGQTLILRDAEGNTAVELAAVYLR
ncbi:MAG: YbaY family lipoprotein [Silicimonas sp.]